jgi:uncharacterized protein
MRTPQKFWNPYLAGIALGLVLLTAFLVMGRGLGASGASFRFGVAALSTVAPGHVQNAPALAAVTADRGPLDDWLVFEVLGVALGGLVSAFLAGRLGAETIRGPRIGVWPRLALALAGGAVMGMAARLARGCTSGQALSGGALLSVGSWVFMFSVFAGGYAMAWFVRRQWR